MWTFVVFLIGLSSVDQVRCIEIIWDNNATMYEYLNEIDGGGRMDMVRMPNWFFIFPGTKWCGAGNIADDYDDLGEFRDTDKCCRQHDLCEDYIGGHQTKYNLTNPTFYSRLSCQCDDLFHQCLIDVNSRVSVQIGTIYFNALGTQCFKEDHPIVQCQRYVYVPIRKCIDYEVDSTQEPIYQWFDIPPY